MTSGISRVLARIEEIEARIRSFVPQPPAGAFERALANAEAAAEGRARNATTGAGAAAPPRPPVELEPAIRAAAERYGVPAELLTAVVWAESGFNPRAVSPRGAMGLMQIMPQMAEALGLESPFAPDANLDAGARYLAALRDRFGGDYVRALAAYNAGPGAVERAGGVPNYPETKKYLEKIRSALPPDLAASLFAAGGAEYAE